MRNTALSAVVKSFAVVVALVGAMLLGAPQAAQAAPVAVSSEIAGPAPGLTTVQYGGGHWRHHGRHHRGYFGHRRGRHYGHHFGRRFGHHRHHRGHHYGRRFRF